MKNLKNSTNQGYENDVFTKESKTALKMKEMIRNFRKKNLFYLEHSKFATYIPDDYLTVFKEVIVQYSKAWIRMQQKNMSSEKNPGIEGHANTRGLHVQDTALNAQIAAQELLLNEDLAYVGGLIHDIAHTAFAHEGEHFLSTYLQKQGICEVHHSSLARLLLEIEGVHEKTLERLEEQKGRKLTEEEKNTYNSAFLTISDIAVCHNGEGTQHEVKVNRTKTDEDVNSEYIMTFVKKGLDRKTQNRTKEGAIVLFCDPISYVAKDFRDGIIKETVNVDDKDYEKLFIKMGLTKDKLDEWGSIGGKKDRIVAWITRKLRDDLVKNSRDIDGIRMSESMANNMYELRNLNYEKAVKPSLRKINDILPERIEMLIEKYSKAFIDYENTSIDQSDVFTKYFKKMHKKFTVRKSEKVEKIYREIVKKGIIQNLLDEYDDVIKGEKNNVTERRARFEEEIGKLRKQEREGKIVFDTNTKKKCISSLLEEIMWSPNESKKQFHLKVKKMYPNASAKELAQKEKELEKMRLLTYSECIARMKVAVYIGEATNDFLLSMLQAEGLMTAEEKEQRYILGGDATNSSINSTIKQQDEEKRKQKIKTKQAEGEER